MPQVTVYVRDEDLPKWRFIEKKSEFISNALNQQPVRLHVSQQPPITQPVSIPGVVKEFVSQSPDPEKGYPCCQKKKPCKHWTWSQEEVCWINSITGEVKDG